MPGVYIEGSYSGHKAIPGKYRLALKLGDKTAVDRRRDPRQTRSTRRRRGVREYHSVMSGMEQELTAMHDSVNSLNEKQKQLDAIITALPAGEKYAAVKRDGEALLKKLKAWDEEMIQRRSRPTTTSRIS